MDFSKGKWIINPAYSNFNKDRIDLIAMKEFKELIGDSLVETFDLRRSKLIPTQFAYRLSKNELEEISIQTGFDYLICVKSDTIRDEMGSFPVNPQYGVVKKSNQATAEISIYDLNNFSLVSTGKIKGIAEIKRRANEKGFDYVNSAENIAMKALTRLIKKYSK